MWKIIKKRLAESTTYQLALLFFVLTLGIVVASIFDLIPDWIWDGFVTLACVVFGAYFGKEGVRKGLEAARATTSPDEVESDDG